jgi:hypothetical protein
MPKTRDDTADAAGTDEAALKVQAGSAKNRASARSLVLAWKIESKRHRLDEGQFDPDA